MLESPKMGQCLAPSRTKDDQPGCTFVREQRKVRSLKKQLEWRLQGLVDHMKAFGFYCKYIVKAFQQPPIMVLFTFLNIPLVLAWGMHEKGAKRREKGDQNEA